MEIPAAGPREIVQAGFRDGEAERARRKAAQWWRGGDEFQNRPVFRQRWLPAAKMPQVVELPRPGRRWPGSWCINARDSMRPRDPRHPPAAPPHGRPSRDGRSDGRTPFAGRRAGTGHRQSGRFGEAGGAWPRIKTQSGTFGNSVMPRMSPREISFAGDLGSANRARMEYHSHPDHPGHPHRHRFPRRRRHHEGRFQHQRPHHRRIDLGFVGDRHHGRRRLLCHGDTSGHSLRGVHDVGLLAYELGKFDGVENFNIAHARN